MAGKAQNNMRIWDQVSKTDPKHTKKVNQRGGFTAIDAQYQIETATKIFGPVGEGWGYDVDLGIVDLGEKGTLALAKVTLWHGDRNNTFGPIPGCKAMVDAKGRVDDDAPKKAVTDGLTKALSQLGFNADVFLGQFDDNKYVQEMNKEFGNKTSPVTPDRRRPATNDEDPF